MKVTIHHLKIVLLVDTRVNAVINSHGTTTRKHDSQIAPSLIERNTGDAAVLLGDTGYHDQKVRSLARDSDIPPVINTESHPSLVKPHTSVV